jgi:hypothetical protein
LLPAGTDFDSLAALLAADDALLLKVVSWEAGARRSRGDEAWWRGELGKAATDLERRHWAFSLVAKAHTSVVVALSTELNELLADIPARNYAALRASTDAYAKTPGSRELLLNDAFRLGQADFSPRTLWLLRATASQSSREQIDKRLPAGLGELLEPGMGDMRELLRIAGSSKTVAIEHLRGARDLLPVGGWASNTKLAKLAKNTADNILRDPAEWPGDVVQRAIEAVASRIATSQQPLATAADVGGWFEEPSH